MQIGPRIRVGGTVGKIGQSIKNALPSVPAMVGTALLGPVGGLAGSALNHSIGSDLMKGAKNAGLILGGKAILGKLGGTPGIAGGSLPGGASSGDSGGGFLDWGKGLILGGGKDGQGNFGALGDLLGGQGGSGLLDKLLMGGSVAAGAIDQARKQGLQNKAVDYATGDYDKNAGLRDQARSMLSNRSTPDLSSIFSNPGNPYDEARRKAPGFALGPRVPATPTNTSY